MKNVIQQNWKYVLPLAVFHLFLMLGILPLVEPKTAMKISIPVFLIVLGVGFIPYFTKRSTPAYTSLLVLVHIGVPLTIYLTLVLIVVLLGGTI